MRSVLMRALTAIEFDGQAYAPGAEFTASAVDAVILRGRQLATFASDAPPLEEALEAPLEPLEAPDARPARGRYRAATATYDTRALRAKR